MPLTKFVEEAVRENTKIVFTETIANPVTQVADLVGIGQVWKIKPCLYRRQHHDFTFFIQTKNCRCKSNYKFTTKYIGGHGNALGGMVTDTGIHNWKTLTT